MQLKRKAAYIPLMRPEWFQWAFLVSIVRVGVYMQVALSAKISLTPRKKKKVYSILQYVLEKYRR